MVEEFVGDRDLAHPVTTDDNGRLFLALTKIFIDGIDECEPCSLMPGRDYRCPKDAGNDLDPDFVRAGSRRTQTTMAQRASGL